MTTYATLVADIKKFMEDDGTNFQIQSILLLILTKSRDLIVPAFRQRATSALTASDPFITLPSDLVVLENLTNNANV